MGVVTAVVFSASTPEMSSCASSAQTIFAFFDGLAAASATVAGLVVGAG